MRYFSFLLYLCLVVRIVTVYNNSYGNVSSQYSNFICLYNSFFQNKKNNDHLLIKLLWSQTIGCGSCDFYTNLNPCCDGSFIFIADRYGIVKKLDINTGRCIWLKNLSYLQSSRWLVFSNTALISTDIIVDKCHCYIGSELGKVYALDVDTGSVSWIVQLSGEVIARPVVSQGLVLIYTNNGILHALDARNGIIKWVLDLNLQSSLSFLVQSVPVVYSNIIVLGDVSGVVSACDLSTGQLVWQKKISKYGVTDLDQLSNVVAPIVKDNVVYAVAYNGNIVALDFLSGSLIWSRDIGSLTHLILEDGVIYLIDKRSCIVAINAGDGNIIWSKQTWMHHDQLNSIVSYKNYIMVGDSLGYLHWYFKKNGVFFVKEKVSMSCFSIPLIILDKIIIYGKNGNVSIWRTIDFD